NPISASRFRQENRPDIPRKGRWNSGMSVQRGDQTPVQTVLIDMSTEESSQNTPFTDGIRPQWHPRVPREKIRLLYENDARGLVDETLVDDVGIGLLLRCRSILIATEAHEGRARCPRCEGIIPHQWKKDETMLCSACGWQTTWGAYFKTYQ